MAPDQNIAVTFAEAFAGALVLRLRFLHDKDRTRPAGECLGAIDSLWGPVESAQADGYGVFYFPNEIRPLPPDTFAKDEAVSPIRAFFIDCDGARRANIIAPRT